MKKLIKIKNKIKIYSNIKRKDKDIVLFLENINDFIYFEKFLSDLHDYLKVKTLILVSDNSNADHIKTKRFISKIIFIGVGFFRYLFFRLINAKIFFLTTPDLENSELKKSRWINI